MKLAEYASYDALGLAKLVARKEVSAKELTETAVKAIQSVNGEVGAVVELYGDRIEKVEDKKLGDGPFRGVPFLMKDVFGHEKGRKIEFGSRLCKGMVAETGSYLADNFKASGVNIIGRSAAPEYSMSATTETALYGNTSTPWKKGHSAGGSSGGAQAAVTAGMVPIAHGSDIGGSIRIPASWCGGVGLKPSRGRVSVGPVVDEGGFGFSSNLIQARSVRDVAAMLDCVCEPQVGDPFVIPRPKKPYAKLAKKAPDRLRVGIVLNELLGVKVDPEVAKAVKAAAKQLEALGHDVEVAKADMGGVATLQAMNTLFFYGFDSRLDGYAKRAGTTPGPDTLEPCIHLIYEWAKTITAAQFMGALGAANVARRTLSKFWTGYDIWLSPTTSMVSPPWGTYHLSKKGVTMNNFVEKMFAEPCQFTIPHNIMGTPAMSLPLAMHSNGLPIGVQIAAAPAQEHVVLQVAAQFEEAMPWRDRVPTLHVSRA
ncbi:MAG: amidase [Hyphomicrobiales bacterium]|nr:amidase [Hyphomicrobiales bacterium]